MQIIRRQQTLPSYSVSRTSGAIYCGVPTADLGFECSWYDYTNKTHQREKQFTYTWEENFPYQVESVIRPLKNQNHKSSGMEDHFHLIRCSLASDV